MLRKISVLILCLTIGFAANIIAQETEVVTLEKSVSIAMKNNPGIQIAQKEYEKSRTEIWEAYSAILPQVNASANYSRAWDIQQNTIPNFIKQMLGPDFPGASEMPDFVRLSFGLKNTLTYGANLTQPIFLGGAGIAGVKMAYAASDAMKYDYEIQRQSLIYDTVDAFYGSLLAEELVLVQEKALAQAQANLDIVKKMYDVGSASGLDKMRAEVEVVNLKPSVIAARNDRQAALTGLRTVLGLPKETKIKVEGKLQFTYDEFKSITLEALLEKALNSRPELLATDAQTKLASNGVTLARSEFMPKLFFSTDYSFLAMRNDNRFVQDDFSKGFTSAISLQVPLFTGFRNAKSYQKARLDYKIAQDSDKLAKDGIIAEVEIAYNKFQEAQEKYLAAKESIDLAEEALRLANLMYEEGASTQLDVLISQLALTEARLNHASALYEYQMARYQIRKVTGTLEGVL